MKITLLTVGRLKERYWREAVDEYAKRLGRYVKLAQVEVADLPTPDEASAAETAQIRRREGQSLLAAVGPRDYVVAMDGRGEAVSSEGLSEMVAQWQMQGQPVDIIIGGSLGLSPEVLARADRRLSMGKMTFPHQLARVMVLEQLYRAFRILRNEPYHK